MPEARAKGQRGPNTEAGGNDNLLFVAAAIAYMLSDTSGQLIPQRGASATGQAA